MEIFGCKGLQISCALTSDQQHLPPQVPGHPDGLVNTGLLGLPGVRVNVRGEGPSSPLPHPQVSLVSLFSLRKFDPLPSLATIAGYWLWFLYLKYLKMESEASKEVER